MIGVALGEGEAVPGMFLAINPDVTHHPSFHELNMLDWEGVMTHASLQGLELCVSVTSVDWRGSASFRTIGVSSLQARPPFVIAV